MAARLRRRDLRPRQHVRNKVSGLVAEVRGLGDKLLRAHPDYVGVRLRIDSGKNKHKMRYPYWLLENLELVPDDGKS
jgi:hypothetical protein